jgi:hypothetical protein
MMFKAKATVVATLAVLLWFDSASAQGVAPRLQSPGWSADSLLNWFELEAANAPRNTGDVGMARVLYVLRHSEAVAAAKQDSVADGLERMALSAGAPEAVKLAAVSCLGMAGAGSVEAPLRTVAHRLVRIYHGSNDRSVRTSVLMLSSTLSDRAGMIPLLREVATAAADPPRSMVQDDSDPAALAVGALANMGEVGQAVLSELARNGSVRSPRAQAELRMVMEHRRLQ